MFFSVIQMMKDSKFRQVGGKYKPVINIGQLLIKVSCLLSKLLMNEITIPELS